MLQDTSQVLASFVVTRAPLSCNAKLSQKYRSHITDEFNKHKFSKAPFLGPLYIRVYYFHHLPDSRDADNFSKHLVDTLCGIAYADDKIVVLRSAANIHLPSFPEVDVTQMSEPSLRAFLDAQLTQKPILYIEIGQFSMPLLSIGGS